MQDGDLEQGIPLLMVLLSISSKKARVLPELRKSNARLCRLLMRRIRHLVWKLYT